MAYRSSDVPEFNTYPESPQQQAPESFRRSAAAYPASELNESPRAKSSSKSSSKPGRKVSSISKESPLHEPARQIGAALGHAVASMREGKSIAGEWAEQKKAAAQQSIDATIDATVDASERYGDLVQDRLRLAQDQLDDLRERASDITRRARRDYPVQLILTAGAIGLLAGVGLRIWRDDRGSSQRG